MLISPRMFVFAEGRCHHWSFPISGAFRVRVHPLRWYRWRLQHRVGVQLGCSMQQWVDDYCLLGYFRILSLHCSYNIFIYAAGSPRSLVGLLGNITYAFGLLLRFRKMRQIYAGISGRLLSGKLPLRSSGLPENCWELCTLTPLWWNLQYFSWVRSALSLFVSTTIITTVMTVDIELQQGY